LLIKCLNEKISLLSGLKAEDLIHFYILIDVNEKERQKIKQKNEKVGARQEMVDWKQVCEQGRI